jgi:hypothetical protein
MPQRERENVMENELDEALSLANHWLDKPYIDPDDDLSVVSRQLIRQHETAERYKQALQRANGFLIMHNLEPVKLEYSSETVSPEQT